MLSVITRLLRGGSERRLFDMLQALPVRHTIIVGAEADPAQIAAAEAFGEVVSCPALVRDVAPADDLRALAYLIRTIRARRVSVVCTHQAKAGLLGRVAAGVNRTPVVYTSASGASFGAGYGRTQSQAFALSERVTAPFIDRFFVVGADLARQLSDNGIADRRLHIVRSSLELGSFTPASEAERAALRARLGIDPTRAVVCYVGRLNRGKGVEQFSRLVERASRATGRAITLLVAGDGPLRDELDTQVRAMTGTSEIRQLGHVAEIERVADLMRGADALILPSSSEGLPQVLVQAAKVGLPFVAYDVNGVHEILGLGAVGRSVPIGEPDRFADALASVLTDGFPDGVGADPSNWAQWDPAHVRQRYRTFVAQDLGITFDG